MRRSSILIEFSKIAQTPPPVSNAIPIKGQVTAADIDRCRAQLKKRIDDDGTKDRCAVLSVLLSWEPTVCTVFLRAES